jgi:AcrR family transcriptional regulator/TPR repeat protein
VSAIADKLVANLLAAADAVGERVEAASGLRPDQLAAVEYGSTSEETPLIRRLVEFIDETYTRPHRSLVAPAPSQDQGDTSQDSQTPSDRRPLYTRLPHGPSGMTGEDVKRNQRARLYGAMIEAVARSGYDRITIAHVITLAGVSRRAFYEQFTNKEDCFLGAYDIVIASTRKRALKAWKDERGWENRMRAAFKAVLDYADEQPKSSHLVLVDALSIGGRGRERMQLASLVFERLVSTGLQSAPEPAGFPQLTSRAIVAGVRQVAFNRTLAGQQKELPLLSDEVLRWIGTYRTDHEADLRPLKLAEPCIAAQPAKFLVEESKRARMLGAVAHLTLDEGYSALTDPQVAQFAGVSTAVFHKEFASREECFLALLEEITREAIETARPALEQGADWEDGAHRAVSVFVEYFVQHQALLRLAFVDVFELGSGMVNHLFGSAEALVEMITEQGPAPLHAPLITKEAIIGAVWGIISSLAANNRIARLRGLDHRLAYVITAPYIGTPASTEGLRTHSQATPVLHSTSREVMEIETASTSVILQEARSRLLEAEAAYRRADDRGDMDAAFYLGNLLAEQNLIPEAEAAYRRADERGHAGAASNLGLLLETRGHVRAAEAAYRRADERGHAGAATNLGLLLQTGDRLLEAEAAYRRADDRGDMDAAFYLGNLLAEQNLIPEAEAAYRRADERGHAGAASNLGLLLERQERPQEAEIAYRRADERGHALASFNLGRLLQSQGRLQGAEAAYRRADERGHGDAAFTLALLLQAQGRLSEADDAYRRADERRHLELTGS